MPLIPFKFPFSPPLRTFQGGARAQEAARALNARRCMRTGYGSPSLSTWRALPITEHIHAALRHRRARDRRHHEIDIDARSQFAATLAPRPPATPARLRPRSLPTPKGPGFEPRRRGRGRSRGRAPGHLVASIRQKGTCGRLPGNELEGLRPQGGARRAGRTTSITRDVRLAVAQHRSEPRPAQRGASLFHLPKNTR